MEQASGKLTVFFDPPFWVGVFERIENGKLTVSKVTFGAEPKDYEVYDFILHHYYELKFSPPISTDVKQVADNPKRRQRNARKQMQSTGVGTNRSRLYSCSWRKPKPNANKRARNKRKRISSVSLT